MNKLERLEVRGPSEKGEGKREKERREGGREWGKGDREGGRK